MLQSWLQWLRRRTTRVNTNDDQPVPTNYTQDREDNRLAHMSEEDRAWQAASLQREQESRKATEDS
jgi:hypothetical protein